MPHDNTNRGVLFKNERMRPDKEDPNLAGSITFKCSHCEEVTEHWLNGWTNEAKSGQRAGQKYISIVIGQPKRSQPSAAPATPRRPDPAGDFDDDIPF